MSIFRACVVVVAILAVRLGAQLDKPPIRMGPGMNPPHVIHKVEPEYPALARADRVQGTVVLQIVVDEQGLPTKIEVVSPLGFGFEEKAQEAIQKWRFTPGFKDGHPVKVLASVEVNFRFPALWFDASAEHKRTSFNLALTVLKNGEGVAKEKAVKTITDLARQKYPAAMYVVGLWEMNGENVPKDPAVGWAMIQKAAERNYGPALYEVGARSLKSGNEDPEKAWTMIRDAAILGSVKAQFALGLACEKGTGTPKDPERARRYFRLCAAKGEPYCQLHLARLLFENRDQSDDQYLQALAWFELAADHDVAEARSVVDQERPKLTPAQVAVVRTWKIQLGQQKQ
jgi:TonB family protein